MSPCGQSVANSHISSPNSRCKIRASAPSYRCRGNSGPRPGPRAACASDSAHGRATSGSALSMPVERHRDPAAGSLDDRRAYPWEQVEDAAADQRAHCRHAGPRVLKSRAIGTRRRRGRRCRARKAGAPCRHARESAGRAPARRRKAGRGRGYRAVCRRVPAARYRRRRGWGRAPAQYLISATPAGTSRMLATTVHFSRFGACAQKSATQR